MSWDRPGDGRRLRRADYGLGGEVKVGELVTKIIIEDGMATGVETEFGNTYSARYVICNTDPFQMVFKLIGEENLPKDYVDKIKGMKPAIPSSASISVSIST